MSLKAILVQKLEIAGALIQPEVAIYRPEVRHKSSPEDMMLERFQILIMMILKQLPKDQILNYPIKPLFYQNSLSQLPGWKSRLFSRDFSTGRFYRDFHGFQPDFGGSLGSMRQSYLLKTSTVCLFRTYSNLSMILPIQYFGRESEHDVPVEIQSVFNYLNFPNFSI